MQRDRSDPPRSREEQPNRELERLRKGYKGELQLANHVMAVSPGEIVIRFGAPVDTQGPDILSVGPHRMVTKWDTGWRRIERSVGVSNAAADSVDRVLVEPSIWTAIATGRLSLERGIEALRRFDQGDYDICRTGSGEGKEGLMECVRKGERRVPRRT